MDYEKDLERLQTAYDELLADENTTERHYRQFFSGAYQNPTTVNPQTKAR